MFSAPPAYQASTEGIATSLLAGRTAAPAATATATAAAIAPKYRALHLRVLLEEFGHATPIGKAIERAADYHFCIAMLLRFALGRKAQSSQTPRAEQSSDHNSSYSECIGHRGSSFPSYPEQQANREVQLA